MSREAATFSTRRLEALTDGVFAIAMTLLILDIRVQDLGSAATNGQLWQTITNMQGSLVSFLVSFLLLGSMWSVHMRQFEFIKQADRRLTTINTLRLLAVVLIPLTTSIAGSYPDIALGRILFPLNFLMLAIVSYWEWNYAVSDKNKLYDEKLTAETRQYSSARNKAIVVISFIVVVGAALIGEWAFLLFLLSPWLSQFMLSSKSGLISKS